MRQSVYSDFVQYKNGQACGLQLKAKIDGIISDDQTEAQQAGLWFEDMIVRGESKIEPTRIKSGELNATYRSLSKHIEVGRKMVDSLPKPFIHDTNFIVGEISGKPDIVCSDGRIVDIKTTAHISNKYDSYGWGALFDSNSSAWSYTNQLERRLWQAATYCYLSRFIDGIAPCNVFEFWVFSSTSEDVNVLKIELSNETIDNHINYMMEAQQEIVSGELMPIPEYTRCKTCKLFNNCEFAEKTPQPKVIKV